ncbi:unnamed protein product [Cylicocyclus nassatus]|uniref:TLDc domain-containing protein n=1 Tax=Cylicocyclus nassatus TaxID=53992 RepID=A0AA36GZJ5_CYLNA|nr:unnamed protein product [Cylicocyclus nassatus]
MGNAEAKPTGRHKGSKHGNVTETVDKRVEQAFVRLAGSTSNSLTFGDLKGIFGESVAESLWNFLSDSKPYDAKLSFQEFSQHAVSLMGTSTDVYIMAFQPLLHLIKVCSEAAGAGAVAGDEQFIANLAKEMSASGSNAHAIITWKNAICPKFCHALQERILQECLGLNFPVTDYSSDILTPIQMWYVRCSLPSKYSVTGTSTKVNIATATQGISVNRFEANVFDYRGPTVTIFQLTDKSIFVLATEETWRHGSSRFGGPDTMLFQIAPKLERRESSSSIYCNFKIRSAAFGLSFEDVLKINKDMDNVEAAEVWGCASSNALEDQQKLRAWQNKQAEKHKKVPLPGNWDDNPDKTLLEMAGFQFSDEKRRMELDARQ